MAAGSEKPAGGFRRKTSLSERPKNLKCLQVRAESIEVWKMRVWLMRQERLIWRPFYVFRSITQLWSCFSGFCGADKDIVSHSVL